MSRTEGPPVDSPEDDVQAMVIDLLESSKERTSRSKRILPSIDVCADVLP